jgi:hypothetical protein
MQARQELTSQCLFDCVEIVCQETSNSLDFEKALAEGLIPPSYDANEVEITTQTAKVIQISNSIAENVILPSHQRKRQFGLEITNCVNNVGIKRKFVFDAAADDDDDQSRQEHNKENSEANCLRGQSSPLDGDDCDTVVKKLKPSENEWLDDNFSYNDLNKNDEVESDLDVLENTVREFLTEQKGLRLLSENSISPIQKESLPPPPTVVASSEAQSNMSLVLTCQTEDFQPMESHNHNSSNNNRLEDFYVNTNDNTFQPINPYSMQLNINTNLDDNYQPQQAQRELHTPPSVNLRLNYFNNQFIDEMGFHCVQRQYTENSNTLLGIASNVNHLVSNQLMHVYDSNNNIIPIPTTTVQATNVKIEEASNKEPESEDDSDVDSDSQLSQDEEIQETSEIRAVMYKGYNLSSIEIENLANPELDFAFKAAKVIFDESELSNGIFPGPNGKNMSKARLILDKNKTSILKDAISAKFSAPRKPCHIESTWKDIRSQLNQKIGRILKKTRTKNDNSIISGVSK